MTVKELIKELQGYPSDAVILYRAFSEYNALEPGDVSLYTKDDKEKGIICHKGQWMSCRDAWRSSIQEAKQEPKVDAVVFPGN